MDISAGDAMMGEVSYCLGWDWNDTRCSHTYSLWDSKTQGEMYHIYLLAIACLIEDRLGEKAFVCGDITQGQCRKAVELANQYLKKPIRIPARCESERLLARIRKLPLTDMEKAAAFEYFYLGIRDMRFGDFERDNLGEVVMQAYWKQSWIPSSTPKKSVYTLLNRIITSYFVTVTGFRFLRTLRSIRKHINVTIQ